MAFPHKALNESTHTTINFYLNGNEFNDNFNKTAALIQANQDVNQVILNLSLGLFFLGLIISSIITIFCILKRKREMQNLAAKLFPSGSKNLSPNVQKSGKNVNPNNILSTEASMQAKVKSREELIMDIIDDMPEDLKIAPDAYENSWMRKGYDYAILDQQQNSPMNQQIRPQGLVNQKEHNSVHDPLLNKYPNKLENINASPIPIVPVTTHSKKSEAIEKFLALTSTNMHQKDTHKMAIPPSMPPGEDQQQYAYYYGEE
ncbi:uncharacterized protein LOC135924150 [Gordionus sp. m RMFG-2023]|uniref:uncharacterized protein LOC135924150 n=1 Tax=Gordionus sp. m RMFG-2023 TaxID=3053472 RepID=UPI0031FDBE3A